MMVAMAATPLLERVEAVDVVPSHPHGDPVDIDGFPGQVYIGSDRRHLQAPNTNFVGTFMKCGSEEIDPNTQKINGGFKMGLHNDASLQNWVQCETPTVFLDGTIPICFISIPMALETLDSTDDICFACANLNVPCSSAFSSSACARVYTDDGVSAGGGDANFPFTLGLVYTHSSCLGVFDSATQVSAKPYRNDTTPAPTTNGVEPPKGSPPGSPTPFPSAALAEVPASMCTIFAFVVGYLSWS